MRQVKAGEKSRSAKTCSACGAKMWMWDVMMHRWSGPWHFQDCPSVPGGAELTVANLEERERLLEEKTVSKKQGQRILKAIMLMMNSPRAEPPDPPNKIMLQRKAAIQEEIKAMRKEKISVGGAKP